MLSDLIHNQVLIIAACTWVITQAIKTGVILFQEKRLDWNYMISSGGMPSAHYGYGLLSGDLYCYDRGHGIGLFQYRRGVSHHRDVRCRRCQAISRQAFRFPEPLD